MLKKKSVKSLCYFFRVKTVGVFVEVSWGKVDLIETNAEPQEIHLTSFEVNNTEYVKKDVIKLLR